MVISRPDIMTMKPCQIDSSEVLKALGSCMDGLSASEAQARLETHGHPLTARTIILE